MRGNVWLKCASAALVATAFVFAAKVLANHERLQCPGDLELRYNESCCARSGVNPFRVWSHDVSAKGFVGIPRPDMEGPTWCDKPDGKWVHAYPPWHVAYTWFYGAMPLPYVVALVYLLYGLSLSALFRAFRENAPARGAVFYWSWCAFCMVPPVAYCLKFGNYSILCAGALLCMTAAAERREALAGLLWGLMMVKPQLASLFLFPLLFQGKYVAIAVAALTCLLATLWPAHVYGESPLALIMQVPQIAAPYETGFVLPALVPAALLPAVKWCWLAFCTALCGWCSWTWRSASNPVFRYAPAAFLFPLWTYSQPLDKAAAWPFVMLVALLIPKMSERRGLRAFSMTYVFTAILASCLSIAWGVLSGLEVVASSSALKAVYHGVDYAAAVVYFIFGLYVLAKGPAHWLNKSP